MRVRLWLILQVAIASLAMAFVGILSYGRSIREDDDQRWVAHTHQAIETIARIRADLIDAESGERGFVITGEEPYLQPYESGIDRLQVDLKDLRNLTADNLHQQHLLDNLEPFAATRLRQFREVIAARKEQGLPAGITSVREVQGKATMDQIRAFIVDMEKEERRLLNERLHAAQSSSRITKASIIVCNAVALLFLLVASLAISREMEKRHKAEEGLLRANRKIEAANRELESFSYSVSHDLRAPLRAIDGFSLALLEDCHDQLNEEGNRHLHRIRSGTERMAQLIDGLLNLARISRIAMTSEGVDLCGLAREIVAGLQTSAPERQATFNIPAKSLVRGDRILLRSMLENLLGNAWKFTSTKSNALIELGAKENGGETIHFVRDNGVGFDMRYADKLFGAFQRLHDSRDFPGTGIGLATVQKIIHRHGGRIWAESEVGKGTTFFFTLTSTGPIGNARNGEHGE